MQTVNEWGQPVGFALPGWRAPSFPEAVALEGSRCRVEPLNLERHVGDLFETMVRAAAPSHWTYLPYGPFQDFPSYRNWLESAAGGDDPLFYAIVEPASGRAVGLASYLRITPASASIEVGHLSFSPELQQHTAATEAMYLMMKHAFELGYRRYEWKCDALNAPSRRAALRLGFYFEGIFRQATVYKGRNRDTAWYSVIDGEWPALARAFERWLAPDNFDAAGQQRTRLSELTAPLVARSA